MRNVVLISTYELGHQPFGLASPAAWLKQAGANVTCLDLAVRPLDESAVQQADLIAIYLPMHTATRLATELIPRLKGLSPRAHLCGFGLYAPTNAAYLKQLGLQSLIGGEFESGLVALFEQLAVDDERAGEQNSYEVISLARQQFLLPDRSALPELSAYAGLLLPDGRTQLAGYTEASRGCKHLCRHCPIVPVYNGRFRIVQADIVLADIRQQVAAGAQHISFGDPDFLNGPRHALQIVEALHSEFPDLTYDVTIKIEHLIKQDRLLPTLQKTGCLFITSAVEAVDDRVLALLDKGHTRADFLQAASRLRDLRLVLNPTFVAFTPWTTPQGFLELLSVIHELGLVENVSPIQYAIRLLIPAGSRLLDLPEIWQIVDSFDPAALCYPWQHPDPEMDRLYERVFRLVKQNQHSGESRRTLFGRIWQAATELVPEIELAAGEETRWALAAEPVPALSESWY
jgi:radical SAM superfamily enzyme YgiQ (UPF0313 family)